MEIFGPTIQGEGKLIGQKTMFIRTAGCDYKCSWCDSAFTWDGSEKATLMTSEEVLDALFEAGGDRFKYVTISGGNPALYADSMANLIQLLHQHHLEVSLETQGSIWQDWLIAVDDVTISPKPPSSGMQTDMERLDEIIHKLHANRTNFSIKIVVFDQVDLEFAKLIFNRYRIFTKELYLSVGNPAPRSEEDVSGVLLEKLNQLFNWVIADPAFNDVKPLPQLHTLVWNNKRGV
jgi:7-carboxy-7-deazaguanine synthase